MAAPTLVCSTCRTPLPETAAYCWVCGTPTPIETSLEGDSTSRPSLQSAQAVVDTRRRLERALGTQFSVGDLVGRGGFAEVFAVRDQRLKRDLAVKVLSPELVVNQAMLTRFRREAEAVAALRHPGIVPIYDIGEAGGIAYILMPLIKGDTLRKVLEQEGRLSIAETRRILIGVAEALRNAHEAGLVHRDIKPENIMVEGPRRLVLVMDFGIAKAIDPDATGVTTSGLVVGTPHYMSPEQASGEPVDARSDQYSLAVMGYRMVTGTHPFEAETTRALLYKQVFESPPPAVERFPDVPPSLSDALARGMSKEPKDRFPTIHEFAEAVSRDAPMAATEVIPAVSGVATPPPKIEPVPAAKAAPARAPTAATAPRPKAKPRRWVPLAAVGALGAVAIVAAIALSGSPGAESPGPPDPQASGPAQPATPPPPPPPPSPAPASTSRPDDQQQTAGTPAPGRTRDSDRRATVPPPPPPAAPVPVAAATGPQTCAEAARGAAFDKAVPLCWAEAEQGQMGSQVILAGLLERGQGVTADPAEAAKWYERAVQAGSGEAAFQLGHLYAEGRGVDRNLGQAGQLFLQAARRGVVPAMRTTAQAYETGNGLPRNDRDAVSWYRRAAAAGDTPSQTRLGDLFFEGRGVSKSEAEGARWYARAAAAGDPAAQYALGMAYFFGRGVAPSDSLAIAWLERAAQRGHQGAVDELARRKPQD